MCSVQRESVVYVPGSDLSQVFQVKCEVRALNFISDVSYLHSQLILVEAGKNRVIHLEENVKELARNSPEEPIKLQDLSPVLYNFLPIPSIISSNNHCTVSYKLFPRASQHSPRCLS